jgi:uncharacterized membrane protein
LAYIAARFYTLSRRLWSELAENFQWHALDGGIALAEKQNKLVLAYFESEELADKAVAELKTWDKASDDVKLGAIGILVKGPDGKIKTEKVGARAGGKGAKTGIILGVIAAILSGGLTLVGGLVIGAAGGGILGSLFHQKVGLSDGDIDRIRLELDEGHAAVGVMVTPAEVAGVSAKLKELGGEPQDFEIPDDAVRAAEDAESAPDVIADTVVHMEKPPGVGN